MSEHPSSSNYRILNVDDNEAKRYVTSRTLRNAGYSVLECGTGSECLEMASAESPDLIILDVGLPDMNGFDVCEHLKNDPQTSSIPVLHLSASYTSLEDKIQGLKHGADAYMTQPMQPREFIATVRSLLRMQEAEEELRIRREQLELAQQKVRMGTWEWDLNTGKINVSATIPTLHGRPPRAQTLNFEEWLGGLHPDDQPNIRRKIEAALAGNEDYDIEFRSVWSDGSVHWIGARGAIFRDLNGTPSRVLGVSLDVSERKFAEAALRESERLVAAGRMAATVAHEINNPLAAIVNIIFLLKSNPSLDAGGRELLDWADRELSRVNYIVSQTLGFYRTSERATPIAVSDVVQDILSLLSSKFRQSSLRAFVSVECKGIVSGHFAEVRQIISNLIINALEASEQGGNICVRVVPSRNWRDPSKRGVRIFIHDNGGGIPQTAIKRIFEPFFSTKTDKGTGLGLWVIRNLISKYGGTIFVHSTKRPIRCTSFSVFLPTETGLERMPKKWRDHSVHDESRFSVAR